MKSDENVSATALTTDVGVTRICGERDALLALMGKAAVLIEEGFKLSALAAERAQRLVTVSCASEQPEDLEGKPRPDYVITLPPGVMDRSQDDKYKALFGNFQREKSLEMFRRHTDARIWAYLLEVTNMRRLMDAKAYEDFARDLATSVPEVSEDNVHATFEALLGDAHLIFARGLARTFSNLDRRFKSHDGFKIGSRIILPNVISEWGGWNYNHRRANEIADVERTFAVLDGKTPEPGLLRKAIDESRAGWGRRQGVAETPYFRVRTFMNGNAHLWFTRDDLVEKANLVLADYYGAVLPDGVPKDGEIKVKSGLPAKNLSFYASTEAVVRQLVDNLYLGNDKANILEPSAGDGSIVRYIKARHPNARVHAIEIHPGRVAQLRILAGVSVQEANFLRVAPAPVYTIVLMNPPFYGEHWMDHVLHAYEFLAPGGVLRAVLPMSACFGESKRHVQFRKWAAEKRRYRRDNPEPDFTDLPAESFAASGTRVSTTILELWRS